MCSIQSFISYECSNSTNSSSEHLSQREHLNLSIHSVTMSGSEIKAGTRQNGNFVNVFLNSEYYCVCMGVTISKTTLNNYVVLH